MLRVLLVFLHDVTAAAAAWSIAHWLRFNMDITPYYMGVMFETLLWVVPLQAVVFWTFGLYRGIWRYASLQDLKRLLVAIGVCALVAPVLIAIDILPTAVPRSVLLLDPILLVLLMSGSRIAYRVYKEHDIYGALRYQGQPVLVLGGGDAALTLQRELERSPAWRVVGFLDDDPQKVGRLLNGVKVYGRIADLPQVSQRIGVTRAVLAMPGANHVQRRAAVRICAEAGVEVLTVPSYDDLVSGRVTVSSLREVELDDLLGRDPVKLDDAGLHALLTNHVVMVTGAGGSIGSELCRQIARFGPSRLVLYEASEFALYSIEEEFKIKFPDLVFTPIVGDVKDEARVNEVAAAHRPNVVFHAAAYKHVPLMENDNAWAALRNNVYGTYVVAAAAAQAGAERFVLISTDKAVNPVNVMGATKRLAEVVCQALQATTQMSLVAVRFGNVLGSAGSVIPKFRQQIARGGPITVTHPEIIRYFMSIPEAAQLVLQAALMGKGGEVFMLQMGEPVRIVDLARDMIRLSGMSEDEIAIEFTGLRPGEKLYEELVGGGEDLIPTPHPKLLIVSARKAESTTVERLIPRLREARSMSPAETKALLKTWVPEYEQDPAAAPPLSKPPARRDTTASASVLAGPAQRPALRP